MKYELFSSAVVLSMLLLVAGLVVFAPAANDASRLAQSEMGGIRGWACKACQAGWVTVTQQVGGIGCEHGPEHDVDCGPNGPNFDHEKECFESNGNKTNPNDPDPNTGDGFCKCYECKPDNWGGGCENDIRWWLAWCGMESQTNCGKCDIEADGNGVLRQQSTSHVQGGGGCNYGQNTEVKLKFDCGRNGRITSACLSSNCVSDGNWQDVDSGQRMKCK